jgi:prolyl-tRNA synthetase
MKKKEELIKIHKSQKSKMNELGIQNLKEVDFSKWYIELIQKSELIEYTDISGCYVLRPNSYEIWEYITKNLNHSLKKLGVKNAYFPLFISKSALTKEETHLKDFCPEVAWVTSTGDVTNPTLLVEPLAIRPTSETSMYPHFSKWIRTHRQLPMKINQWNNVVRWEFTQTIPFIRSREFLWQEGHNCFATKVEAMEDTYVMIDVYETLYKDLLAIPTIKGTKTDKERFAGADLTRSLETYVSNGKAIQAATSHYLGTNFSNSKMFDIKYESEAAIEDSKLKYVHQTSWGFTTRSIGVMIMTHSDNIGLVVPPRVAPVQVIIVPIYKRGNEVDLDGYANTLMDILKEGGIRVQYDSRKEYRPGFKYNQHELMGVPLRIDIGVRDIENQTYDLTRRDTKVKTKQVPFDALQFVDGIRGVLDNIHHSMYNKALDMYRLAIVPCTKYDEIRDNTLNLKLCLVDACGAIKCEETIKTHTKTTYDIHIKSLCIPDSSTSADRICISCQKKYYGQSVLFGRSY